MVSDDEVLYLVESACMINGVTYNQFYSSLRKREVVNARKMVSLFLRQHKDLTLCEIGRLFNKDHSLILDHIRKAQAHIETETEFRENYLKLKIKLPKC